MDPVTLDALAKAAAAQAIADKALQIAVDCLAEIKVLKAAQAGAVYPAVPQYVPDPFSPEAEEPVRVIPNSTVAPRKVSPFKITFAPDAPVSLTNKPLDESNVNFEKALSDEEALKDQLWDDSVGN